MNKKLKPTVRSLFFRAIERSLLLLFDHLSGKGMICRSDRLLMDGFRENKLSGQKRTKPVRLSSNLLAPHETRQREDGSWLMILFHQAIMNLMVIGETR